MRLTPRSAAIAALTIGYALRRSQGTQRGRSPKHREAVIRHWQEIARQGSRSTFIPAAPLALRLLLALPEIAGEKVLRTMGEAVRDLEEPREAAELMQSMTEDRKELGVYHTLPHSATLMAHLAVPQDERWADPQRAGEFRMADYSCGSGELLVAAYRRVRELQQEAGTDPGPNHPRMMAGGITAADILPASVATELTLMETGGRDWGETTRALTLRQGPLHPSGRGDEPRRVGLGSLDLLEEHSIQHQDLRPIGRGEETEPLEFPRHSQDLVVMNPPYSKPSINGLDRLIPNTRRGIQPTTDREKRDMEGRMARIRKNIQAGPSNGLALHFSHIADAMVKPGGTIALLLPMSVINNNTTANSGRQEGWSIFRQKLARDYNRIVIVSIAAFEETDSNFSHDTGIAEVMLVARRNAPGEEGDGAGCFINLRGRPESKREATLLAKAIQQAADRLESMPLRRAIDIEGTIPGGGTAVRTSLWDNETWNLSRVMDPGLVEAARMMSKGLVPTREDRDPAAIPTTPLGDIATIGTPTPSIEANFGPAGEGMQSVPVLVRHDCTTQRALEVRPEEELSPKSGRKAGVSKLEAGMSRLHLNDNHRYNSQPLSACMTPTPSIGGRGWPNVLLEDQQQEKALAVWLNTSLALLLHWARSNHTQNGLGYLNRRQMGELTVLDVTALPGEKTARMAEIFERVRELPMLPANDAWRDPIRTELDRQVLVEALRLGEETFHRVRELCQRWCLEPTVQGRKGGVAARRADMERLEELVRTGSQPSRDHDTEEVENRVPEQETPPIHPAEREKLLREISDRLGLQVHAVCRTGETPRRYNIRTERGPVPLGPVANILSQSAFRDIVADTIQRVVTEQRGKDRWNRLAEKILQASVEVHQPHRQEPALQPAGTPD